MSPLKIGVQLSSFRVPFRRALELAARSGAQTVEIDARRDLDPRALTDTGVRQIRKWMDDFNLKPAAVRFRTRRGYHDLDELERRIRATRDAMQLAYRLGATVVVNQVGTVPAAAEGPEWEILVSSLTELANYGQRLGAFLSPETGSEEGSTLAKLLEALPAGSMPVTFNPGNLIVHGFSAADALQALAPHVAYVHARDAVRDLARGRGLEVPLGRGIADFPQILGVLEEHAYRGTFTVDREGLDGPVEEVNAAVAYLRRLGSS